MFYMQGFDINDLCIVWLKFLQIRWNNLTFQEDSGCFDTKLLGHMKNKQLQANSKAGNVSLHDNLKYILVQAPLREKYYVPQVWPDWGWSKGPPDCGSTFCWEACSNHLGISDLRSKVISSAPALRQTDAIAIDIFGSSATELRQK